MTIKKTTSLLFLCVLTSSHLFGRGILSESHFGFAVQRQSSSGYEGHGGSLFMLDVLKPASPISSFLDLSFGLRTIGLGAKGESGDLYRMGFGPVLKAELGQKKTWVTHMALTYFREKAYDQKGDRAHTSQGYGAVLGWQRRILQAKVLRQEALNLSVGGFLAYHQGKAHREPNDGGTGETFVAQAQTSSFPSSFNNQGLTQGVLLSLELPLE